MYLVQPGTAGATTESEMYCVVVPMWYTNIFCGYNPVLMFGCALFVMLLTTLAVVLPIPLDYSGLPFKEGTVPGLQPQGGFCTLQK